MYMLYISFTLFPSAIIYKGQRPSLEKWHPYTKALPWRGNNVRKIKLKKDKASEFKKHLKARTECACEQKKE